MTSRNRKSSWSRNLFLILSLAAAAMARAQITGSAATAAQPDLAAVSANVASEEQAKQLTSYVESGASYLRLTNGFGYWASGYTRAVYDRGKDGWNAEVNAQHEFGDMGAYLALGDTRTLNGDWYASLTLATSAGGFFLPRFRIDAFLNRKWLKHKQWITSTGLMYYVAKDVHRDHMFFLGSTYYFTQPWIVETGAYFNLSNPGRVFAPAGFVAITQGRDKHQYVVVRAGAAEEAYQLIGPSASLNQFQSQTVSLTWRKWLGTRWGFNLVGDYYHSRFYQRTGTSLGLFKEF